MAKKSSSSKNSGGKSGKKSFSNKGRTGASGNKGARTGNRPKKDSN